MRSLSGLSVRNLRRRPARFALTGAGAALGVAVLYAVLVTSGATNQALDDAISGSAGEVDVFVGPVGSYDATLAPEMVDRVAALDDVDATVGSVVLRSLVRRADEAGLPNTSSRDNVVFVIGSDLDRAQDLREFDLESGALPAPDAAEVVVAHAAAEDLGLATGDAILLATPAGDQDVTISGVLEPVGAGLVFQGAVGYTSTATAQQMLGKGDVITGVDVALADGVDSDEWIDGHRDDLGEALTIQDAEDVAAGFREFITAISSGLTLMSVIAVFVGGFLVFLTFSVAVAERTQTYGTLRALGSSARPGPSGGARRGRGSRPDLEPRGSRARTAHRRRERGGHRVAPRARPARARDAARPRRRGACRRGRREPGRRLAARPACRGPRPGGGDAVRRRRHRTDRALGAARGAPRRRRGAGPQWHRHRRRAASRP